MHPRSIARPCLQLHLRLEFEASLKLKNMLTCEDQIRTLFFFFPVNFSMFFR